MRTPRQSLLLPLDDRLAVGTYRCRSGEHLAGTLQRYVDVYNAYLPQRAPGHVCPLEALRLTPLSRLQVVYCLAARPIWV